MKIVVVGATGLTGAKTVGRLRKNGHEVVPASRSSGVSAITGEGTYEGMPECKEIHMVSRQMQTLVIGTLLPALIGFCQGGAFAAGEKVLSLQLFLIIMSIPLMFLAAAIREQEQTEQALRVSEKRYRGMVEEQADLAGRLIAAQEEERKRLNRELHEDLNQQVAALAIGLGRLGRQLPHVDLAVRNEITKLETKTTLLSERMSRLSHELHSSTLEHVGLVAALKLLCIEFSDREKVSVSLDVQGIITDVPAEIALCLYRVTQESLRNIAEHSGAKSARLTLIKTDDALELRIVDRGVGFDPLKAKERRGLGLVSIEERIRLSHGSFEIESHPGSGTELKVSIPFRKES